MNILVVEDEALITDFLRRGLEAEGYAVDTAACGEDGLALLRTRPADLVILDVMMPGMDGFEVLGAIRASDPELPVIMLTARGEVADRVRGLDLGATDYLGKPFAFAELLARIRALLRRGRTNDTLHLRVGDLDMDLVSRKVARGGQSVDLTVREFELLEYLMRHENQVVPRDTLARDVWKETSRGTPLNNVIDVHIARLRRKVDAEHGTKLIHTIRGIGFMLRDGEP